MLIQLVMRSAAHPPTAAASALDCDVVVVTVPLGVLKEGCVALWRSQSHGIHLHACRPLQRNQVLPSPARAEDGGDRAPRFRPAQQDRAAVRGPILAGRGAQRGHGLAAHPRASPCSAASARTNRCAASATCSGTSTSERAAPRRLLASRVNVTVAWRACQRQPGTRARGARGRPGRQLCGGPHRRSRGSARHGRAAQGTLAWPLHPFASAPGVTVEQVYPNAPDPVRAAVTRWHRWDAGHPPARPPARPHALTSARAQRHLCARHLLVRSRGRVWRWCALHRACVYARRR